MVERLRNLLQPARWRFNGPVTRSANDYATHIPILVGLARARAIESVLELGSGHYSTKTFLNRRIFPHLRMLDSYETDNAWATAMKPITEADPRSSLHVVNGLMASVLKKVNPDDYDLIFVDDSNSASERVRTIDALAESGAVSPLIVIHDFEVPEYINVARQFRYRYPFKAFNPETGVVWQNGSEIRESLKVIDEVMKRHAQRLEPDDVDGWFEVFLQVVGPTK
jgi:hypothetical protein